MLMRVFSLWVVRCNRFREARNRKTYLMRDGVLRLVPDQHTLAALLTLGLAEKEVIRVYPTDKPSYTFGTPLPSMKKSKAKQSKSDNAHAG